MEERSRSGEERLPPNWELREQQKPRRLQEQSPPDLHHRPHKAIPFKLNMQGDSQMRQAAGTYEHQDRARLQQPEMKKSVRIEMAREGSENAPFEKTPENGETV